MSDTICTGSGDGARFFVFMGVCGVGKSTVAEAFAQALGGAFVEADAFHSPHNVATMSEGRPLSDADRWPWLEAVCEAARAQAGAPVAIACSALRKSYRDFIRERLEGVVFVHLHGPEAIIRDRMSGRSGHFMPATMLESQLAALEAPANEPDCHGLDIRQSPDRILAQAVAIARPPAHPEKERDGPTTNNHSKSKRRTR